MNLPSDQGYIDTSTNVNFVNLDRQIDKPEFCVDRQIDKPEFSQLDKLAYQFTN